VRLGHDAAPAPEDRTGSGPSDPSRHRPRNRLPAGDAGRSVSDASRRPVAAPAPQPESRRLGPAMSFRARLTTGLVVGSVVPLAGFGLVLLGTEIARTGQVDTTLVRV